MNEEKLALMKPMARLMHPLPHGKEIDLPSQVVDHNPKVAFVRQSDNGLYSRMGGLDYVLELT